MMAHDRKVWRALPAAVVVALVAWLPWWHNHAYLRDFYDYGLVIAGNARILAGERPYVDFATPIQSGLFIGNLAAERAFGGTLLAMTWGAAVAIVAAATGLTLLFARRWPVWLSALVSTGVVVGSLSQHTILWHNALGVGYLAAVAWSGAVAPVWRWRQWPWHAIMAAALLLGGLNKLNFQLLALAVAVGWALREWLAGRAEFHRLGSSVIAVGLAGVAAPLAIELAWTRASFGTWWYNVVTLPLAARGGDLHRVWSWQALWHPVHDYYGALSFQPVGLLCLVTAAGATAAAWRGSGPGWGRRAMAVGAGLLAAIGSLALFATNFEIAYVALAAAVALAAGLWLGFGAAPRGLLFMTTLVAPAAILAGAAWESAWRGQRSQFGHSTAPRASYADAGKAGPAFSYLRGMNVPPEWIESLVTLEETLSPPGADGTRPVLYGPAVEWLERVFPAAKHPGLPLWMHFGTTYGPRETACLVSFLADDTRVTAYYVAVPWSYLPEPIGAALKSHYDFWLFSAYFGRWTRKLIADPAPDSRRAAPGDGDYRRLSSVLGSSDGIDFVNRVGGNVNPLCLEVRGRGVGVFPRTGSSASVVGISAGRGYLRVGPGVRQLRGEVVVRRTASDAGSASAEFEVRSADSRTTLWSQRVQLEQGVGEQAVPFVVYGDARPLELAVEVPEDATGQLMAGFRQTSIQQTDAGPAAPPRLRPDAPPDEKLEPATWRSVFPGGTWSLSEVIARGVSVHNGELQLPPGAELWFKPDRPLSALSGEYRRAPSSASGSPMLRLVWCKGARLEILTQERLPSPDGRRSFRGWSAEPDGWFGLLADPGAGTAPALARFNSSAP
jgi:hypothetical protein